MKTSPLPRERALGARELFAIDDVFGLRIGCAGGSVWLTLDRDPRDIVLDAGQDFVGREHRRGLVYAFAPSRLTLGPAAAVGATAQPAVRPAVTPRPPGRTVLQVPV